MTTLTKEECIKTLEDSRFLEVVIRGEKGNFEYYSNFEDTVTFDLLKQLINEHFDNPPLRFEELEKGMWVWDNRIKAYLKIQEIWVNKVILFDNCCVVCFFQENRFYRKELKE